MATTDLTLAVFAGVAVQVFIGVFQIFPHMLRRWILARENSRGAFAQDVYQTAMLALVVFASFLAVVVYTDFTTGNLPGISETIFLTFVTAAGSQAWHDLLKRLKSGSKRNSRL